MGYEITFHYHEEISKGEYNREDIKKKTVKLGTEFEDVSLDTVAGKIISQLARRNVLVVDVEIYEFVKKKISFKETPDGILIKNKKFSFDEGAVITTPVYSPDEEAPQGNDSTQQLLAQILANPAILAALGGANGGMPNLPALVAPKATDLKNIAHHTKPTQVLRFELFNPIDKIFLEDARKRGMAFTLGKKYPIYAEKAAANQMIGMLYTTVDDKGQRQMLSDKFFTPDVGTLEQGFGEDFKPAAGKKSQGDGLDWSGFSDETSPDIRG